VAAVAEGFVIRVSATSEGDPTTAVDGLAVGAPTLVLAPQQERTVDGGDYPKPSSVAGGFLNEAVISEDVLVLEVRPLVAVVAQRLFPATRPSRKHTP
jgi:hypothetical protein